MVGGRKYTFRKQAAKKGKGSGGGTARNGKADLTEELEGGRSSGFNLKWSEQENKLIGGLREVFRDGGDLTDVSLFGSDGECVEAHKLVLTLCSSYFQKLFKKVGQGQKQKQSSSGSTIIVLGNVTSTQIRNILQFVYTGEVHLKSKKELDELEKISEDFGITGLYSKRAPFPEPAADSPSFEVSVADPEEQDAPPVVHCKVESQEPQYPNSDPDDNFYPGGDDNAADLSEDSNWSEEELEPNRRRKPTPKKKAASSLNKTEGPSSPPNRLSWRTGRLQGWAPIEPLPDEVLQRDWRKRCHFDLVSNTTEVFYCGNGKKGKCPAALKIKTLNDGTSVYMRNCYEHANHYAPDYRFGLTEEQKKFVHECIDNGVLLPNNILLKFEIAGRTDKPTKQKLVNFMARYRRKRPEIFGPKPDPKWPRRIRKRKPYEGPPKKRGRPTLASQPDPTAINIHPVPSSDTGEPFGAGGPPVVPHPNHFLGQPSLILNAPAPPGPPPPEQQQLY